LLAHTLVVVTSALLFHLRRKHLTFIREYLAKNMRRHWSATSAFAISQSRRSLYKSIWTRLPMDLKYQNN
jgi:hypothetical protein